MTERSLFLTALEKDDPDQRAGFLDEACGDDAALRDRVDALLRAHETAGSFLETPLTVGLAETHVPGDTDPGAEGVLPRDLLGPPDEPGHLGTLGPYEIVSVIGRGGMGIVLKGHDRQLNRTVALKVLAPELAMNPTARQRFLREAQAAAAVRHAHVVTIHAIDQWRGTPYLVMEFIAGPSLQERLDHGPPPDADEIARIGRQTASGLAAAHAQGLIHRDIKPANILLEGDEPRVKITDFGLARAVDDVGLTQSGLIAGTPQFMSPEQAAGGPVDHRTDLFSLGSVLYTLATGRPPFQAESSLAVLRQVRDDAPPPVRQLNPALPEWLAAIIDCLLAKDPDDRFPSAAAVAEALAQRRADPPVTAPRRWWKVTALIVVVLLAGLAISDAAGLTAIAPTVLQIVTGEGTIRVIVSDPAVKVTVDGQDVVITGAGPNEVRVRPGRHRVQADQNGRPVFDETITITRGDTEVVRIEAQPQPSSKGDPQMLGAVRRWLQAQATPPLPQPAGPVETLRTFTPQTAPETITQDGIAVDEAAEAWRIMADEPRTVRLFEVADPDVEQVLLTYRAQLKAENLSGQAYLEMWVRLPGQGEFFSKGLENPATGTTGWASYETPFFLEAGHKPDLIRLNLVLTGKGTVWIKDIALLKTPLEGSEAKASARPKPKKPRAANPPPRRPPLFLQKLRSFEPLTKYPAYPNAPPAMPAPPAPPEILAREGIAVDEAAKAWRITADGPRTVLLSDVQMANVYAEHTLLLWHAELKTGDALGKAEVVVEIRLRGEKESRSKTYPISGTSRWASYVSDGWIRYDFPFDLQPGQFPERVRISLVFHDKGTIWIRHAYVEAVPIPPAGMPVAGLPLFRNIRGLGSHSPTALPTPESLAREGITFDEAARAWRITADAPRTVVLFEMEVIEANTNGFGFDHSKFVGSPTLKTEDALGKADLVIGVRLQGQKEFISEVFPISETSRWANHALPGWTIYDVFFDLQPGQKPDGVRLSLVFHDKGTIWLKGSIGMRMIPESHSWRAPVYKTLRAFTPRDTPETIIPQSVIAVDKADEAWRITVDEPRIVRLFEVDDLEIENAPLECWARMKTGDLRGEAYLEMRVRVPGQRELVSKMPPLKGTTGWSDYSYPFGPKVDLKAGQKPELVRINLVVNGTGTIWIQNVQLLEQALEGPKAPAAKAPPAGETPPAGDEPAAGPDVQDELRRLVELKRKQFERFQQLRMGRTVDQDVVDKAEAELLEAQLRLAQAEHGTRGLIEALEQLLKNAERRLERLKKIALTGAVAADVVDEAEQRVIEARLRLEAARAGKSVP